MICKNIGNVLDVGNEAELGEKLNDWERSLLRNIPYSTENRESLKPKNNVFI